MTAITTVEPKTNTEQCPWCESPISRSKFIEIRARIAEQEKKKLAVERARMTDEFREERKQIEARHAQETEKARTEVTAQAEARVRAELNGTLKAALAERDQALTQVREVRAREESIREEEAAKAKAQIEAKTKEMESQRQQEVQQVREALEGERDQQLAKQAQEQAREREQLQKKITALDRQLQNRTSNELAEMGEVGVYEALREAFPNDDISRIKKGQPGADIRQRVLYKGASCGTIVTDSKNRRAWQNGYVTKLRDDQMAAQAEHAVLATTVFPSGKKELHIDRDTGVIIVHPSRVVELVELLRTAMIQMHCLGLSLQQRREKKEQLYKYIASEVYRRQMAEADRLTSAILDLDADEKRAHDKIWEKRGKMATRLRKLLRDVDRDVAVIIEGDAIADEEEAGT